MAGAGGGGFIFVLTKEPNMVDEVKNVIKKMAVGFFEFCSVFCDFGLIHKCLVVVVVVLLWAMK